MRNKRTHALVTLISLTVPVNQLSCAGTLGQKKLQAAHAQTILYGVPHAPRQFGHTAWHNTMQMSMALRGTPT